MQRLKAFLVLFPLVLVYFHGHSSESPVDHVPGQYVVWLANHQNPTALCEDHLQDQGCEMEAVKCLSARLNIWLMQSKNCLETNTMEWLLHHEGVREVQFNHTNLVLRGLPNDSLFFKQWHLRNDGSNGGDGLADMSAAEAWDVTTGGLSPLGEELVIAVVDQGFDTNHVDLDPSIFRIPNELPGNGVDDDGNGFIDDCIGWNFYTNSPVHAYNNHGTHVAGIAGAAGNNGVGISGVNWNVKVLPITGASTLESTVIEAYSYILDLRLAYNESGGERGAYIVATNSSFGVDKGQPEDFPIWCAFYDSLGSAGILNVAATANANVDVDSVGDIPTSCPSDFLISVTNSNSEDQLNGFAATGKKSIDLCAPGTRIYSTTLNDTYGNSSGTSMSAPQVAGGIALMHAAMCRPTAERWFHNPDQLALWIRNEMLEHGIDSIDGFGEKMASAGRLNLYKSVQAVHEGCFEVVASGRPSSCGGCTGSALVVKRGGSGNVSYNWSTGDTGTMVQDLCPGIHTVTATDELGHWAVDTVVISSTNGPEFQVAYAHPICFNDVNGSISIVTDYEVQWLDGGEGLVRTGLPSGSYIAVITDSLGLCANYHEVNLYAPQPLALVGTPSLPSSEAASDGKLTATASGGVGPYEFQWQDGSTGRTLSDVPKGMYGVTVTDANGCTHEDSLLLGYPVGQRELTQSSDDIFIYPNPATSRITIVSHAPLKWLEVMNAKGQRLLYQSMEMRGSGEHSLDLAGISPGHHWIRLFTTSGEVVVRPLVQISD